MAAIEFDNSLVTAYDMAYVRYSGAGYAPIRRAIEEMDEFERIDAAYAFCEQAYESMFYTVEFVAFAEEAAGDDFALFEDLVLAFDAGIFDAMLENEYGMNRPPY